MFKFLKKPKTIELYVVTLNEEQTNDSFNFLTITSKKEHCQEYIHRRLLIENKEHYTSWCSLRGIDYKQEGTWESYIASTGSVKFDKYIISKVKYDITSVATIFRMFNDYVPIGASYEDPQEVNNFFSKLTEDELKNITDSMKKEFNKK
jgi:hypothetical protein